MTFRGFDPVNGARSARRQRRSKTIDRVKASEERGFHEVGGALRQSLVVVEEMRTLPAEGLRRQLLISPFDRAAGAARLFPARGWPGWGSGDRPSTDRRQAPRPASPHALPILTSPTAGAGCAASRRAASHLATRECASPGSDARQSPRRRGEAAKSFR